jgi:NAD(P)H-flavin reductase/hemoglobin-like flavoprotein
MDTARLQNSFALVAAHGDEVPLYFYSHLFLTHPETRAMFPASMAGQRDRFVGALLRIVGNVHQLDAVIPYLQQLGRDHRKYGVVTEHYPVVGPSLLATLGHFLGDQWTPDLAADWASAYNLVAQVMTDAAKEAEGSAPPWYDAEVVAHEDRASGIAVITVRPEQRLPYQPGQSVSVQTSLTPRMWRYLSPANAPRSDNTIEFHVRAIDGGWVSPALVYSTGKGDVVRLAAPVGTGLVLDDDSDADLLLLAGGTGLAPLRALIEQLDGRRQRRNVDLYVGAHTEAELYDLHALRQLQERNRWLSVVPVVERGSSPGLAIGEPAQVALGHRRWQGAQVYVCGSPEMVQSSLQALASAGIDTRAVRRETYSYNGHVDHVGSGGESGREPGERRHSHDRPR